jgi:enoyl-CoA hydratase/carnithine racemase
MVLLKTAVAKPIRGSTIFDFHDLSGKFLSLSIQRNSSSSSTWNITRKKYPVKTWSTNFSSNSNCLPFKHKAPLAETFDVFLQQIKHHGEGSVTVKILAADEKVADICLDNPSKRNCLSGRMIYQLITIIDDLSTDPRYADVVALLLRGSSEEEAGAGEEGGGQTTTSASFCSGLDFSLAKEVVNTPEQGFLMCSMMTEALTRLRRLDMISVALIHGPALGGGAELATACDFRLITNDFATLPSSQIGFVHAKLGASPGWGGGGRLVQLVGRSRALLLLGTARVLSPQEALEAGLVDALLLSSSPAFSSSRTSAPPPLPSSFTPAVAAERGSQHSSYVEQSLSFLQPFTSMQYPSAVKDMKYLIGGITCTGNTEDTAQLEKEIFRRRWGSKDNLNALRNK